MIKAVVHAAFIMAHLTNAKILLFPHVKHGIRDRDLLRSPILSSVKQHYIISPFSYLLAFNLFLRWIRVEVCRKNPAHHQIMICGLAGMKFLSNSSRRLIDFSARTNTLRRMLRRGIMHKSKSLFFLQVIMMRHYL